jgi:hypothetical protein
MEASAIIPSTTVLLDGAESVLKSLRVGLVMIYGKHAQKSLTFFA